MLNTYVYKIADEVIKVHRLTKEVVVEILNSPELQDETAPAASNETTNSTAADVEKTDASFRRRRRAAAASHDVKLVRVDPPVKDERLRTSMVATDQGQNNISDGQLVAQW